jgi:uncharacterized membrane protein YfcA
MRTVSKPIFTPPSGSAVRMLSVIALVLMTLGWFVTAVAAETAAVITAGSGTAVDWWLWPLALFAIALLIGVVSVMGGIGGGTLFVPVVGALFPFHLDFVRGAGLILALAGALAAGPQLLRDGLASLRLAMPLALFGSVFSVLGAMVGLSLSASVVQIALGVLVCAIALMMLRSSVTAEQGGLQTDAIARALGIRGRYVDPADGSAVRWTVHRTLGGVPVFALIGFMGGLFGIGAGWANMPALNLLMGAPLKLAAGTSGLLLSVVNTSATWVYINRGAVLPLLVVPTVLGVMLGAMLGGRLLRRVSARTVRYTVVVLLLAAGLRSLIKGLAA